MRLPEKDRIDMDLIFVNIALDYIELNDYAKANVYFDKGLNYCSPSCLPTILTIVEFGVGKLLIRQGNFTEAEKHISKSYRLAIEKSYKDIELASLTALAEVALEKSNLIDAFDYLNRAQSLVNEERYKDLGVEVYQLSSEYYSEIGNHEKANFFLKKYLNLKEKIFNARMRADFLASQIQFSQRENILQIESQEKILFFQTEAIFRQKLLSICFGVIAILMIGIAVILFRGNSQKQRVNIELDKRVRERTIELEKGRDILKHSHDEQTLILTQVASDLTASLATIKGLLYASHNDLSEKQASYIRHAEITTERLITNVRKFIPSSYK